jgi:hypothetical protein
MEDSVVVPAVAAVAIQLAVVVQEGQEDLVAAVVLEGMAVARFLEVRVVQVDLVEGAVALPNLVQE